MVRKVQFENFTKLIVGINIVMLGLGAATSTFIPIKHVDYIAFILMTVVTVLLVAGKPLYKKNMLLRLKTSYMSFVFIWLTMGLLSTFLNHDNWEIRQPIYFSSLIAIAISLAIYITCTDIETFKFYAKSFMFSTVVNYFLSINELAFGKHITEPRSLFQITTTYVGFSNQNNYATFLIYSTIIAYLIFKIRDRNKVSDRMIFVLIFGADFFLSVVTGSITGIAAHLLIMLIFLIRVILKIEKKSICLISTVVIGAYILLFIVIIFGLIPSNSERISYLNKVISRFGWNFLFGLGAGGSVIENEGWVHNLLFELLFDYGMVVFLFFIRMMIKTVLNYKRFSSYELVFAILLMPIVWISSSSALSLHFTWSFMSLITIFPILKLTGKEKRYVYDNMYTNI